MQKGLKRIRFPVILLTTIILIGLFLRLYKFSSYYVFDHDQDLYSWIVKDVLVDHHIRLIGQLTSIDGVFIGPLYYYLLLPFFALLKMDPQAALIPAALIAMLTILSIFYVFSKLFSNKVGILGSFLYATSTSMAFFDRWVVPTQPTVLWSVWYVYALFLLLRGDWSAILLVGILLGLIWHIHIAFLPLILLVPLAIFLSKKKVPNRIYFAQGIFLFFLISLPFWIFELRHGFQQVHGFINALTDQRGESSGFARLPIVLSGGSKALSRPFLYGSLNPTIFTYLMLILLITFTKLKRLFSGKQAVIIVGWVFLVLLSQEFSKRATSDYYFNSLMIISILLVSLSLAFLTKISNLMEKIVWLFMILFLVVNLIFLFNTPVSVNGYLEKRGVIEYIKKDSLINNYPCVGINYIAAIGTNVGFRYLSWLYGLNVVQGGVDIPVYNVTIPLVHLPNEVVFGNIGLLLPEKSGSINIDACRDPSRQLKPLLGFTR